MFVVAGVLLVNQYASRADDSARETRPNVLVILTDDMRWDALGTVQREQGNQALYPWFKTPHLDRLAAEGARFANAFVTTSLCSPSRASLLSGQYAHRHQVLNNFTDYPHELPGYPRQLHDANYETAYIGKWHMGEDDDRQRPGFDFWMSHRGQGNYWDNEFNINGDRRVLKGYYTSVVTTAAVDWIRNAFAHLKVVGFTAEAMPLLEAARVAPDADAGMVMIKGDDFMPFITAAKQHRIWDREPAVRKM